MQQFVLPCDMCLSLEIGFMYTSRPLGADVQQKEAQCFFVLFCSISFFWQGARGGGGGHSFHHLDHVPEKRSCSCPDLGVKPTASIMREALSEVQKRFTETGLEDVTGQSFWFLQPGPGIFVWGSQQEVFVDKRGCQITGFNLWCLFKITTKRYPRKTHRYTNKGGLHM